MLYDTGRRPCVTQTSMPGGVLRDVLQQGAPVLALGAYAMTDSVFLALVVLVACGALYWRDVMQQLEARQVECVTDRASSPSTGESGTEAPSTSSERGTGSECDASSAAGATSS